MKFVAFLILGTISLLLPPGTDRSRTQRPASESEVRHGASESASPSALETAHTPCPGAPGLAEPGAAQGEEDDHFDDDLLSLGPFPPWPLSTRTDLSTSPRPSRGLVRTLGRTLPIRC
jgi:hypothetical protein